jgi:hypothetical protein
VPGTVVRRWVGAGFLPGRFGEWGASVPAVVLEVAESRLTVRLRPKFLARLLGIAPLVSGPGSGLSITASRRRSWGWLIEFRRPDGLSYYFQTTAASKDAVLSCLAEAGFEAPVAGSS